MQMRPIFSIKVVTNFKYMLLYSLLNYFKKE